MAIFQTSYIYGRTKGIDIREHGSGNAGTTNALRTLGKKAGAITLAGDCIKCILAVLTVRLIFGASHPELLKLLTVYAAAGTILGHNFPFYLGFRGGKGIAATAGLIISFDWRITLVCAALIFPESCSNTLCFPRFHDGLRCHFLRWPLSWDRRAALRWNRRISMRCTW